MMLIGVLLVLLKEKTCGVGVIEVRVSLSGLWL